MAKTFRHICNKKIVPIRGLSLCVIVLLGACSALSVDDSGSSKELSSKSQAELNDMPSLEQTTSVQTITASNESKAISPINEVHPNSKVVKIPKTSDTKTVNAIKTLPENYKAHTVEINSSKKMLKPNKVKDKKDVLAVPNQEKGLTTQNNPVDLNSEVNSHDLNVENLAKNTKFKNLTLESLPISIGHNWLLNRGTETDKRCALFYQQEMMQDGQGGTPVSLIITNSSILFKTKSNIDLAYAKTGITIDQHTQLPIERLLDDRSIVYENRYGSVVKGMKSAQQVVLTLGFWPSWPATQTYSLNFDIRDFSLAFNALESCVSLEKQLH